MKYLPSNPYYRAALALIIMAVVLVATAILADRGDFTSAALVISGLVCLLTGIFFATLSNADPLDLRYMSLLPVQGCINLARICADMGIQGNACFIPDHVDEDETPHTMQFIPVAEYHAAPLPTGSFATGPDTAGLITEPSAAPLINLLRERDHLAVPSEISALQNLVRELGMEVLEVAGQVSLTHEGDVITVTMEEYLLIGGCRAVHQESPKCCMVNPCPVCSLFASVYAEGMGKVIKVERCAPEAKSQTVKAVFSVLPE
ncbi:hypothetical protein [uncultured Methanoregula sp.]|uniref:hypothetical protein n=1 Tax=uncultured Methanoregula sp. TaxID=1005933 RepID=UPI002AAC3DBB|nr:hypothetical protein [uncultured Methanoregula sp.]